MIVPATRHRPTGALVVPDTMAPAGYDCASVMVVFGNDSPVPVIEVHAPVPGGFHCAYRLPADAPAAQVAGCAKAAQAR